MLQCFRKIAWYAPDVSVWGVVKRERSRESKAAQACFRLVLSMVKCYGEISPWQVSLDLPLGVKVATQLLVVPKGVQQGGSPGCQRTTCARDGRGPSTMFPWQVNFQRPFEVSTEWTVPAANASSEIQLHTLSSIRTTAAAFSLPAATCLAVATAISNRHPISNIVRFIFYSPVNVILRGLFVGDC